MAVRVLDARRQAQVGGFEHGRPVRVAVAPARLRPRHSATYRSTLPAKLITHPTPDACAGASPRARWLDVGRPIEVTCETLDGSALGAGHHNGWVSARHVVVALVSRQRCLVASRSGRGWRASAVPVVDPVRFGVGGRASDRDSGSSWRAAWWVAVIAAAEGAVVDGAGLARNVSAGGAVVLIPGPRVPHAPDASPVADRRSTPCDVSRG